MDRGNRFSILLIGWASDMAANLGARGIARIGGTAYVGSIQSLSWVEKRLERLTRDSEPVVSWSPQLSVLSEFSEEVGGWMDWQVVT